MHNKNIITIYINSSYAFTIQKCLFSLLLMILKTRAFRNNAIPLSIYLLQKIIWHLWFEKIVFYLCNLNNNIQRLITKFDEIKLSSLKVSLKKKKILSVQRKFRFWVFFGQNMKSIIAISKSVFFNVLCKNKKHLNLGQKLLYLGIFSLQFEKAIVIFETSALGFVLLQSLVQK